MAGPQTRRLFPNSVDRPTHITSYRHTQTHTATGTGTRAAGRPLLAQRQQAPPSRSLSRLLHHPIDKMEQPEQAPSVIAPKTRLVGHKQFVRHNPMTDRFEVCSGGVGGREGLWGVAGRSITTNPHFLKHAYSNQNSTYNHPSSSSSPPTMPNQPMTTPPPSSTPPPTPYSNTGEAVPPPRVLLRGRDQRQPPLRVGARHGPGRQVGPLHGEPHVRACCSCTHVCVCVYE